MLTLTSEQFASKIKQHSAEITKLLERDLPRIIGREAVSHFKKNFQHEGWERTKWKEVQRRENSWTRGAKKTRKILTGDTGDLGRSIQFTNDGGGKVTIHSDLIYAAIHNFGGTIHKNAMSHLYVQNRYSKGARKGRFKKGTTDGHGFTVGEHDINMPQRQFIGDSDVLNAKIKDIIETKLNQIFSK